MRTAEGSFLAPLAGYPYVEFAPKPGKGRVIVTELRQEGDLTPLPNVTVSDQLDGSVVVAIDWPEMPSDEGAATDRYVLNTLAEKLVAAVGRALSIISEAHDRFIGVYPDDHTVNLWYPVRTDSNGLPQNCGWTSGFWVGELALAYQLSKDDRFLADIEDHFESFQRRLDQRIEVDHHDLGFLYTLAGTLPYYLTGDTRLRDMALQAADVLMERYLPQAGIIQAWGDLSDPSQRGRAIIDSLMNLPLLYWASNQTGNTHYAQAAQIHAHRLLEYIIRPDDTTHHTYYFDPETGEAKFGKTAQGATDHSTWARGQAWGVYGFALAYRQSGDLALLDGAVRCADRFLSLLPADSVPFWDMIFTDGDREPRDSSAAAIAVCGLLELAEALSEANRVSQIEVYHAAALQILESLIDNYATQPGQADALLDHAVYSKPDGRGVDEGSIWGDYFYLEALARLLDPTWINPWHPTTGPAQVHTQTQGND
ncbi:glycoside hydrolase family 88 protein [Actinomyces sp. F1_1611]